MISPARKVAFGVVGKTEEGGYASDLLLIDAARLDSRDAGLRPRSCSGVFAVKPNSTG